MVQLSDNSHNISFNPPPDENFMVLHKATTAYKLWHDWLKNFPKSSRFTLGARLDQLFLELLELLAVANYSPKDKKLGLAQAAIGKNDLLKFYLRLCWEMKLLDDSKFKNLALKTEEIGRLCWSWKTRLEKTSPPTARMEK